MCIVIIYSVVLAVLRKLETCSTQMINAIIRFLKIATQKQRPGLVAFFVKTATSF